MAIVFQPCGDGFRIQRNSSSIPGPSNHAAGESPVRERHCGGIVAFCPAKAVIKRKGRKEHARSLREVEETQRERPNINRSWGSVRQVSRCTTKNLRSLVGRMRALGHIGDRCREPCAFCSLVRGVYHIQRRLVREHFVPLFLEMFSIFLGNPGSALEAGHLEVGTYLWPQRCAGLPVKSSSELSALPLRRACG
jgi:hypothetical protein